MEIASLNKNLDFKILGNFLAVEILNLLRKCSPLAKKVILEMRTQHIILRDRFIRKIPDP